MELGKRLKPNELRLLRPTAGLTLSDKYNVIHYLIKNETKSDTRRARNVLYKFKTKKIQHLAEKASF